MRQITLSDRPNHIRDNYFSELEIFTIYPEDEVSREQALWLLNHEYQRWKTVGANDYRSSELVQKLLISFRGGTARRYVCGVTAIAMLALQNAGKRASLESASAVITEFTNAVGKLPFAYWDGKVWEEKEKVLLGDKQKIKQAFREYRSVSHILAAQIVGAEYLTLPLPFDRGVEAEACMLHTAASMEQALGNVHNFNDWNLWHIRASAPSDILEFSPFEISEELLRSLIGPWLERQQ